MKFTGSTSDRDRGAKELLQTVKSLRGARVEAGLFDTEPKRTDSELTIAQIGAVNEFGSSDGRIPERPWLRRALRERGAAWQSMLERALDNVITRHAKLFPELLAFGERVASDIRRTIDEVLSPPKAESTLRAEGGPLKRTKTGRVTKKAREHQRRFTHPLIWTGLMRASVRARIALMGVLKLTPKGK